jgi:hypothetical protein
MRLPRAVKPVGAIRPSIGIATNERAVQELINLLSSFVDFKIPALKNAFTTSFGG